MFRKEKIIFFSFQGHAYYLLQESERLMNNHSLLPHNCLLHVQAGNLVLAQHSRYGHKEIPCALLTVRNGGRDSRGRAWVGMQVDKLRISWKGYDAWLNWRGVYKKCVPAWRGWKCVLYLCQCSCGALGNGILYRISIITSVECNQDVLQRHPGG